MNPDCKYCHQLTAYAPLKEMEEHGVKVYFCVICSAEYTFWQDGDPMSENLYITIRDKMYRWNYSPAADEARLWYIKNPGIPGTRKNEDVKFLQVFKGSDIPNITPSNFEEKLRTYLLFL